VRESQSHRVETRLQTLRPGGLISSSLFVSLLEQPFFIARSMSKLSPHHRSLINSIQNRMSRVLTTLNPHHLFQKIEREAIAEDIRRSAWLTVPTVAAITISDNDQLTRIDDGPISIL
jgi:hypothetical protein